MLFRLWPANSPSLCKELIARNAIFTANKNTAHYLNWIVVTRHTAIGSWREWQTLTDYTMVFRIFIFYNMHAYLLYFIHLLLYYDFIGLLRYICTYAFTHWGRKTHICIREHASTGSDNGLSPGRRQAIIWTIAGILSIGPSGTNFCEMSVDIYTLLSKNNTSKMSSGEAGQFVFAPICKSSLTGTWAILWLARWKWCNSKWYGYNQYLRTTK